MRNFISLLVLSLVAAPAFASGGLAVPEPESIALITIGVVSMFVARRKK